jgi:uncharacterized peroxidase-related enzyme
MHPQALLDHLRLYRELMFGESGLTRAEREMLAVAVSVENECRYWIQQHGEVLRLLTLDDALLDALLRDPASAPLPRRPRALVDYALKLTRQPQSITADDVAELRAVGLDDRSIHDAASVIAYYNYVNRMASGLGIEPGDWPDEQNRWCRAQSRHRAGGQVW